MLRRSLIATYILYFTFSGISFLNRFAVKYSRQVEDIITFWTCYKDYPT